MWRNEMSDEHKCVLVTVGEMLGFRSGHLILDWGSGCAGSWGVLRQRSGGTRITFLYLPARLCAHL